MNSNSEQLESFSEFCKEHPELRFWQALRAWNMIENPKENFILTAKSFTFSKLHQNGIHHCLKDTYYRE